MRKREEELWWGGGVGVGGEGKDVMDQVLAGIEAEGL